MLNQLAEWFGLEGTFKDHLVQPPLPWAGTYFTRSSCSKPCPTWPWTLPVTGHPQLRWVSEYHRMVVQTGTC